MATNAAHADDKKYQIVLDYKNNIGNYDTAEKIPNGGSVTIPICFELNDVWPSKS